MENLEIILIYDQDCLDCKRMKKVIFDSLEEFGLKNIINVIEYNSDDDGAVDAALRYNIYDIPGCAINGQSFYGKNFSSEEVKQAIKSMV